MATNNSDAETGDFGPMSFNEGVDRLAGILSNSDEAATAEPESEEQVEVEAEAEEVEVEMEADDTEALEADAEDYAEEDDVEYEAADEAADEVEEPDDYVEIDGERVTLDEVGNGYLRQADYTKKTQALAEQRKELEAEKASIAQEREHLKQMLESMGEPDGLPTQEELARLAKEDPLEYISVKAEYDAKMASMEAARLERERLAQIDAQQQQAQLIEYVESQKERLLSEIPELKSERGAQYRADILTYMEGVGFSKDELSNLFDARAVIIADKARKYDALMAKGTTATKKARTAPKVVKPGTQQSKKAKQGVARKQALSRVRKSGSVEDAVSALLTR